MKKKVSDLIVEFLENQGVQHAFGIIGSANAHVFDSVYFNSSIELVCNHHEQASTMAMQSYWKVTNQPTVALVTAGAGSSNAITGVLSAWADSIPGVVISGQENSRFFTEDHDLRMFGIQGYDSPHAVSKMTKYAVRVLDPEQALYELEKCWYTAKAGRPGPTWLDLPMNVQSAMVDTESIPHYQRPLPPETTTDSVEMPELPEAVEEVGQLLAHAERPVLLLGVGLRMAGVADQVQSWVEQLGLPTLVSWSAIDMISTEHPLVMGSAGVYGQRAANFILQSCDLLIALGTRMAIPQVGYDISEIARAAENIVAVDIDPTELKKYPERINVPICADAGAFLSELSRQAERPQKSGDWLNWCRGVRKRFPAIGPEHADKDGFINSYTFLDRLSSHIAEDEVIVTDMGTALLSGHQVMPIHPPQRLITSQGLGEMGFGLPAAIGASVATNKGKVLCLNCDGGMMMNLQELQTVVHYQLPIKIIVFSNDGYLMIKHTQKAVLNGRYAGTDQATGVSCPSYVKMASAFDMPAYEIKTWEDFDKVIPEFLSSEAAAICEVFIHPEQFFHPKLGVFVKSDGTLVSPPLEDLAPYLPLERLSENLWVPVHEKSISIRDNEEQGSS